MTLVWTSPFLVLARTSSKYHYVQKTAVDVCSSPVTDIWHRAFIISNLVVFFILPSFIIMFLYGRIIHTLMKDNTDVLQVNAQQRQEQQKRQQRQQVIVMLLSVIVMFFVCVLPFRVFSLWLIYASDSDKTRMGLEMYLNVLSFTRVMFYLNSACNPVLYNMFSTKFRKAFKSLCSFCFTHDVTRDSYYVNSQSKGFNNTEVVLLQEKNT